MQQTHLQSQLCQVEYDHERIEVPHPYVAPPGEELLDVIRRKSPEWSYEEEWRLVVDVSRLTAVDGLMFMPVDARTISRIVFGSMSTPQVRDAIVDVCAAEILTSVFGFRWEAALRRLVTLLRLRARRMRARSHLHLPKHHTDRLGLFLGLLHPYCNLFLPSQNRLASEIFLMRNGVHQVRSVRFGVSWCLSLL